MPVYVPTSAAMQNHMRQEKLKKIKIAKQKKIDELNQLCIANKITKNQSKAWLTPKLDYWFLQGIQLIKKGLPLDIFIHISSFIVKLSDVETKQLFERYHEVLPSKLFDISIKTIDTKFKSPRRFFSLFEPKKMTQEQYLAEQRKAVERYQNRICLSELIVSFSGCAFGKSAQTY